MQTTLDIADDVLAAAKVIAGQQGKTVGAVLTALARASLLDRGLMIARNGVEGSTSERGRNVENGQ
jgi:hypothetical protein